MGLRLPRLEPFSAGPEVAPGFKHLLGSLSAERPWDDEGIVVHCEVKISIVVRVIVLAPKQVHIRVSALSLTLVHALAGHIYKWYYEYSG